MFISQILKNDRGGQIMLAILALVLIAVPILNLMVGN